LRARGLLVALGSVHIRKIIGIHVISGIEDILSLCAISVVVLAISRNPTILRVRI
jgi:hypothetical protein